MNLKKILLESNLKRLINFIQHSNLKSSDSFIVSYPKSGSTWLRFVLYEIMNNLPSSFEDVNKKIPTVGKHFNKDFNTQYGRFIKTHEPYRDNYKKAIYLVRDVRDIIISEFNYNKKIRAIDKTFLFDDFFNLFIDKSVNRYGNYYDHVNSWIQASQNKNANILFIRFEDLKSSPLQEFKKINSFLNLNKTDAFLTEKIENNTLNKMKEKEIKTKDKKMLKTDKSIPFVRNGKSGGWEHIYSADQLKIIDNKFGSILTHFNYK